MKKITFFIIVLVLFNCNSTKTFVKDGVLWQTTGRGFKDNYKKGSGRLVKNKRFYPYIKKDS